MTLVKAKGMQRVALQFSHVGAARKKADREARAEARRRLLQKLFPSDSGLTLSPMAECACHSGEEGFQDHIFDGPRLTGQKAGKVWLHHLGACERSGGHGSYFGLKARLLECHRPQRL